KLSIFSKGDAPLPCKPSELIGHSASGAAAAGGVDSMSETAQICSCNNVTKGAICKAICEQGLDTLAAVKSHTKAGTGCGGCVPLVADLLKCELQRAGKVIADHLCEHFRYSRTELFSIIKFK